VRAAVVRLVLAMRTTLAVALVALALAPACKKTPPPPPTPACREGLPREDVQRLRNLVRNGTDPCPNLPTPKIAVDASGVTVDGTLLVPASAIPSARPQNVAPLFQALEGRGRLWKQLHAGQTFAPLVDLTVAPDIGAMIAANAVRSIAWGGFAKFHLTCGDLTGDFEYAPPRPPGAPPQDVLRLSPEGNFHDLAKTVLDAKRPVSFERAHEPYP